MAHRNHFLDGMRGIAAFAVLGYHLDGFFGSKFVNGGYLAVDFFFILSGYVIALNYEPRLRQGLKLKRFVEVRLVRLWPLFMLGIVLGLVKSLAQVVYHQKEAMEWWQFAVAVFCNSLMLPVPFAYPVAFPLNSPLWSLSGEMLVNILYGALLFRLATPVIGATMLLAASAIGYYAVTHPTLGLLVGASSPEFHIGLIRVLFGFCCGVLIARAGAVRERPGTPLAYVVAGILAVGLLVPADGDDVVVRDLAFAYLLAPSLVLIGSRIEVPSRAVTLFRWLGDLSYPLYVVHFPIMLAVCFVGVRLHIPVLGIWAGAIAASTIVAAVVIPQDRRVRAWLSSWLGFGAGKSVVVGS